MEQYSDFSYAMLPPSWIFCFLDGCPKADECMLHLSGRHVPENKMWGRAIFPSALKADGCERFKPIRKIRAAYGFDTLFAEVKHKDDKPLRDVMKHYLGSHGAYYRYHNGERLLTPEQQQWILDLFRSYGYTEGLAFDHYRDVYDLE